ncbi:MAG: adenosylcobinamide-phosphate synthase CbiB [Thermodesulfobacteriota bacterium]
MEPLFAWYIVPVALCLDLLIGDPRRLPHPVRLMGWAAERLEPPLRRSFLPLNLSGALFAVILIAAAYVFTLTLVDFSGRLHPAVRVLAEAAIVYTCLSARCLYSEAKKVFNALTAGDLETARDQIGMLVSRDPKTLDAAGIGRAAVETVAENFVDGVLSPLFFAVVLGAPGAVAFKMASTLDSMVGYQNERYVCFGRPAARFDDLLNWLPARLSIPVIACCAQWMFGTGRRVFQTALREGKNHKSPNAGRPEAAFAGALGVKINGPGNYHGRRVEKPWIGIDFHRPEAADILRAARLMIFAAVVSAAVLTAARAAVGLI